MSESSSLPNLAAHVARSKPSKLTSNPSIPLKFRIKIIAYRLNESHKIQCEAIESYWKNKAEVNICVLPKTISHERFLSELNDKYNWIIILGHGGEDWIFNPEFKQKKIITDAKIISLYTDFSGKIQNGIADQVSRLKSVKWVDSSINGCSGISEVGIVRWEDGKYKWICEPDLQNIWRRLIISNHDLKFYYSQLTLTKIRELLCQNG